MADNKKSFVLYTDIAHTVEHLSNEDAGLLFKHILDYVNDKNPIADSIIIKLAFEPIKQSLKRDLKKYELRAERSRDNGSKGGRPKKPKKPSGLINNPTKPRKPDSVSVSVSDSVNDIIINNNKYYKKFAHLKLTFEEFKKLEELGYNKTQIDECIERIENYKKNTTYKSLYLTLKNWLKKENNNTNKSKYA